MKKILLFIYSLLFVVTLQAQTSIADFEDDGAGLADCIATAEWPGDPNAPVIALVSNPNNSGVNTTPHCVKFTETTNSVAGNSLQFAFDNTTAKTGYNLTTNKFVKFMVYSENQTNFDIFLELGNGTTVSFSQTQSVTTSLNTWTEVEFDFTATSSSNWLPNARIHFNNGTVGTGDVYYVDEYYITPTSTVVTPATPPTSIVDFQNDGGGAIADCNAGAEWPGDGNAPVVTLETNPENAGINTTTNCVKFVETLNSHHGNSLQLAFDGTTIRTGHDLVNNKFVKFLVYSENKTSFDVLLELGAGGTPHFSMTKSIVTSLNTWTEVEFDFSGNDGTATINNAAGWISNIRIHFNDGTVGANDTYYVDEYAISEESTFGANFSTPASLAISTPLYHNYEVSGGLMKELDFQLTTAGDYANFTLYVGNQIILDNIDVPSTGTHTYNTLVKFPATGTAQIKMVATGSDITVESFTLSSYSGLSLPDFTNETNNAGVVDETSLKYGGPTIADINDDGHYDLVLNNHNDSPNKLYWNDTDGTFTKQSPDLSLWNLMDLHGSAAGDYDSDGDLDLLMTLGGGNGAAPTPPVLFRNDNGTMTRVDASVGIGSSARGRSPRWVDMDLDDDLDLILVNAHGINGGSGAQHIFYENLGNGTFQIKAIPNLETTGGEKLLITDFNNDNVDDIVLFSPVSLWQGNGDFTFTDVSATWLPAAVNGRYNVMAASDIDMDNDGDLDLYLALGEGYFTIAEQNTVDFFPLNEKLDMRLSGSTGVIPFDINATSDITISGLDHLSRNSYAGGFPIFLGSAMTSHTLADIDDVLVITQAAASGWPATRTNSGLYIGHLGGGIWEVEAVKDQDIYWSIQFTLDGVNGFTPDGWSPNNRNIQDILLQNNGTAFTDVSTTWNIPTGGNHWGVTRGDFNNDSYEDLYVYRFGYLKNRLSDYMLLNTGSQFEVVTAHSANNAGSSNHGDMGQAFDYNNDGSVDILNGDDEYGIWHLYKNAGAGNNFTTIKVGYAPTSNVDPISAKVTIVTPTKTYHKRIGSAGEAHSQSLLNIVHFGLGSETQINSITVRWRDGETETITNPAANQLIDFAAALPVELLNFAGSAVEKGIQLKWETVTELNNEKFEIQRSQNANVFRTIGEVRGNGTTSTPIDYAYLDENPETGMNYYRLKQIDFDGKFEYSEVIAINYGGRQNEIGMFYPNPSKKGQVKLDYVATQSENINVIVFDMVGQLVLTKELDVAAGNNILDFNFSELPKGAYLIQIGNASEAVYRKLVIE
jgi:hypothetical protein